MTSRTKLETTHPAGLPTSAAAAELLTSKLTRRDGHSFATIESRPTPTIGHSWPKPRTGSSRPRLRPTLAQRLSANVLAGLKVILGFVDGYDPNSFSSSVSAIDSRL